MPSTLAYLVISDVRDHGQNLTCDLLGYRPYSEIQGYEISKKKLKDMQDFWSSVPLSESSCVII